MIMKFQHDATNEAGDCQVSGVFSLMLCATTHFLLFTLCPSNSSNIGALAFAPSSDGLRVLLPEMPSGNETSMQGSRGSLRWRL